MVEDGSFFATVNIGVYLRMFECEGKLIFKFFFVGSFKGVVVTTLFIDFSWLFAGGQALQLLQALRALQLLQGRPVKPLLAGLHGE